MNTFETISIDSLSSVTGGAAQPFKPFRNIPATSGVPLKVEQPGVVSAPARQGFKPFNNIPATSPTPVAAVMI